MQVFEGFMTLVVLICIITSIIYIFKSINNPNDKSKRNVSLWITAMAFIILFIAVVATAPSNNSSYTKDNRVSFHVNGKKASYDKDLQGAYLNLGPYTSGQVYNSHGIYVYHISIPSKSKFKLGSTSGDSAHISSHKINSTHYTLTVKRNGKKDNEDDITVYVLKPGYKKNNLDLTVGTRSKISNEDKQAEQADNEAEQKSNIDSFKHSIKSHVSNTTGDSVSLNGEFDVKPYTTNIVIKDKMYDKPSVDYTVILNALHGLQKCNLNHFQNIKITLETKADNSYGNNIGYVPVDWYSFKPSDIKKMNTSNMDQADLNAISVEHGFRPIKTGM